MNIQHNVPLAPLTSLGVGGNAETLLTIEAAHEVVAALKNHAGSLFWYLGFGSNTLISDKGLPGVTMLMRHGSIWQEDDLVVAEAGCWWDDLVQYAIAHDLWGLELMSAIPGGVGAAIVGNIAAYGQAVSDTLVWIDVIDPATLAERRMSATELGLTYRYSTLQDPANQSLIILRAAFKLPTEQSTELTYQSAIDAANEIGADITSLDGRRQTIVKARELAGSLWDYREQNHESKSAGSFFRNPLATPEQAEYIMSFDETGKSAEILKKMNQIHGGNDMRVSAALVMLAAGFTRGQSWGPVRLHPHHVLKIENTGGATAQQIYDVAQEIVETVKAKLNITLQPEPRFLGEF